MRRVPAGLLKRLGRVEQARNVCRPHAAFPPILPLDEWEALAVASQEQLVFLTREYLHASPDDVAVVENDPDDVSHKYKIQARLPGTEVRSVSR